MIEILAKQTIGGFWGGAAAFLYKSTHSNHPGNRFIKCSLILSSGKLTLLYFP